MDKQTPFSFYIPSEIRDLFTIFQNEIRLVGGCVRDMIRHKPIHDYDFATPLPPDKVMDILTRHQIPFFTAGLKHGTVTALYQGKPYEITTLRTDTNTDGRHADVQFVTTYETDSQRRDFTMNALYMDYTGHIFDYTGGLADIKQHRVRFIGNAHQRVREDYLRILRYFRFLADFGVQEIDQTSLTACCLHKEGLKHISIERIRSEMMKLLTGKEAVATLRLMHENQILSFIFPTYQLEELENFLAIYPQATAFERLSVLVPNAKQLPWKWSRAEKKHLKNLSEPLPIGQDMQQNRYQLWQTGQPNFLFHVARARQHHLITPQTAKQAAALTMPLFPLKGADILAIGFQGAAIARQLKVAESLWVKMNFPAEKKLVIDSLLRYNKISSKKGF